VELNRDCGYASLVLRASSEYLTTQAKGVPPPKKKKRKRTLDGALGRPKS
jgi:hypothetical protein